MPFSIAAVAILRLRWLGSSSSAARMPACSFSQTRGTPAKANGRTSGMYSNTFKTSGQKYPWPAFQAPRYTVMKRSNEWARGR